MTLSPTRPLVDPTQPAIPRQLADVTALHPAGPRRSAGRQADRDPISTFSRQRALFVGIITLVLSGGLASLLLLHTWAAQDGFHVATLQQQHAALAASEQNLAEHDQRLEAPARLRAAAAALGMRPAGTPTIGQRHGGPVAVERAVPPPPPAPAPTPSSSAAAHQAPTRAHRGAAAAPASPPAAGAGRSHRTPAGHGH